MSCADDASVLGGGARVYGWVQTKIRAQGGVRLRYHLTVAHSGGINVEAWSRRIVCKQQKNSHGCPMLEKRHTQRVYVICVIYS